MQLAERENAASRKVQPFISSFVWLASSHRFLLSIGQSGAINQAAVDPSRMLLQTTTVHKRMIAPGNRSATILLKGGKGWPK
jgi:hypothetical protein